MGKKKKKGKGREPTKCFVEVRAAAGRALAGMGRRGVSAEGEGKAWLACTVSAQPHELICTHISQRRGMICSWMV
jgi:hypothetical protein